MEIHIMLRKIILQKIILEKVSKKNILLPWCTLPGTDCKNIKKHKNCPKMLLDIIFGSPAKKSKNGSKIIPSWDHFGVPNRPQSAQKWVPKLILSLIPFLIDFGIQKCPKNNPKIDQETRPKTWRIWVVSKSILHAFLDGWFNHFHTTYNIGEVTKIL